MDWTNGTGLLETAYIEIFDEMEDAAPSVTSAQTSRILQGIFPAGGGQSQSHVLQVQFNPLSLSFSSGEAPEAMRSSIVKNEGNVEKQADISVQQGAAEVSFALIFDRSIYADCSVQPEVEGFLALIRNSHMNKIAFHWGRQYYLGNVTSVAGEYTFFNALGIPVRAKIDLSMELKGGSNADSY